MGQGLRNKNDAGEDEMDVGSLRGLIAGVAGLAGLAVLGLAAAPGASEPATASGGTLGFVISDISFALSNATDSAVICPGGLSLGPRDLFALTPEGRRREGENDEDYAGRLREGGRAIATAANGQNICMNPEASSPDPHHPVVTSAVSVHGIDLDGQVSRANGPAASGTCAHDDFRGVDGARGVDNQFFRALGCTNTFQPNGQGNTFAVEMLTGSWGILVELDGVDDLRNDNDVTVRLFANADPIQLSPAREPLENATYAAEQDPRYQAMTRGRIANGVLTTDPVDARFHWVVNSIRLDRPLRDARLRMTINADGGMDGILAGYSPVEEIYDAVFGFRNGRDATGAPAPLRLRQGSSNGYAEVARHTCNGVYWAMKQMADGHRDPATGACTSISTQYRIRAIPAFIVQAETQSANQDLAN